MVSQKDGRTSAISHERLVQTKCVSVDKSKSAHVTECRIARLRLLFRPRKRHDDVRCRSLYRRIPRSCQYTALRSRDICRARSKGFGRGGTEWALSRAGGSAARGCAGKGERCRKDRRRTNVAHRRYIRTEICEFGLYQRRIFASSQVCTIL